MDIPTVARAQNLEAQKRRVRMKVERPSLRRTNTARSIRSWRQPTRGYRLRLSVNDGSGELKGVAPLAPASAPSRARTE
jgi:hypothetical protein